MSTGPALSADQLLSMELFPGLSSRGADEALAWAQVRQLPKEMRIFAQGDPAERAHVLVSGSVRIAQSGADGGQVIVRLIAPGETFGTIALFTDGRYPADAVTLADSVEASWSANELRALMTGHPAISMNVIRILGKRLKEAQERVRELATQRVEQRVAHAVLRLAHQAGHATADGTAIEFPLRRKDLAELSGTTLHTASRILTVWEKAGLLASRHQLLTLCCPAEIRRIAEGNT